MSRPASDPAYNMQTAERQSTSCRPPSVNLPTNYRTAIVLREMEGLSYEEIAELVDCPVGTVRSRIHRARSELREKLTRAMAGER